MTSRCIGVDGCGGAWLAVGQAPDSSRLDAQIYTNPALLLSHCSPPDTLCVDVPIGLTDSGARTCDQLARRLLGQPRGSSVFPAPIRPVLKATTREEASAIGRQVDGRGIGVQLWGIIPYIRAWDEVVRARSSHHPAIYEVHPELCFYSMGGNVPMPHGKKSRDGKGQRRALLDREFGEANIAAAQAMLPKRSYALDDFYDALAALWTARRIASAKAEVVPAGAPVVDRFGLRMAIYY